MAKTYAEAKGRSTGPGRLAKSEEKQPRKLKADWIKEINEYFGIPVNGLDKLTVDSLKQLHTNVKVLSYGAGND
jgi:hypothetical protein